MKTLLLNEKRLKLNSVVEFLTAQQKLTLSKSLLKQVGAGHRHLNSIVRQNIPVYGVTTGFGDSVHRSIDSSQTETLQKNLVSYLLCGSGEYLPFRVVKGAFLIRLQSLSRGHSGISEELIERMAFYLNQNWVPLIPREGSLGASGDLVPLAYLAKALEGRGQVYSSHGPRSLPALLRKNSCPSYRLKAKEGLALVNGTSAMAGMATHNLVRAKGLLNLSVQATSWLVLSLKGRPEAFGKLVNEDCSEHGSQAEIAKKIRLLLKHENYKAISLKKITTRQQHTRHLIQDRYSLRCTPQILGPVYDTLNLVHTWLEDEINSVSDNPLLSYTGEIATGGNFYGGYLSQGMDYLKISLAQIADLTDRQLLFIVDEKSNRGLPANLANWPGLPPQQRHLHHGLKGLHQAASALTSEIMALSLPNSIFSRSTESHNQDKVSLGMSAATQCHDLIEKLLTLQTLHLICLAQALDLQKIQLKGRTAKKLYTLIRQHVPFIQSDREIGPQLIRLREELNESFWQNFLKETDSI